MCRRAGAGAAGGRTVSISARRGTDRTSEVVRHKANAMVTYAAASTSANVTRARYVATNVPAATPPTFNRSRAVPVLESDPLGMAAAFSPVWANSAGRKGGHARPLPVIGEI